MRRRRRRLLVVALAGLLPWVVVTWPGGWYPLFSYGFASLSPFSFTTLPGYLSRVGTVPPHLNAWPLGTLTYLIALAAAAAEGMRRSILAGFLLIAGAQVGILAVNLSGQRGILAVPLGTLWLWAAAVVVFAEPLFEEHASEP